MVLTWKKVSASHEGLPVDEANGIHVHLFQSGLAVPEVHRSLQHFRRHVADCAHLDSRVIQVWGETCSYGGSGSAILDTSNYQQDHNWAMCTINNILLLYSSQASAYGLTSLMAAFSSSPGRTRRFPVSFMDRPKSLITHVPSFFTRTLRLFRSRCETAGLYKSVKESSC